MVRAILGLGVVAALVSTLGCTMCCHPYDYSGPVYDANGGPASSFCGRAGSILGASPEATEVMPEQEVSFGATTPVSDTSGVSLAKRVRSDLPSGAVPGSERIVSVTDRVVGSSESVVESPNAVAETSTESVRTLPSNGWTARRPTVHVTR